MAAKALTFTFLTFYIFFVFLTFTKADESQCFLDYDRMFECDFAKVCRDLNNPKLYGEIRDSDGASFNCNFGWIPFCIHSIPDGVTDGKKFCDEEYPGSKFVHEHGQKQCERNLASNP